MESVQLRLSQRLMLSMDPLVGTGMDLDIVHTPWDMDMDMAKDMVLATPGMGMESVLLTLNQRLMLFMDPMVGMGMDLDIVHTPWDMGMDMVMATVMDMGIMVKLPATNN